MPQPPPEAPRRADAHLRELTVRAHALDHRVLEWTTESSRTDLPPVVLVHGYMDAAGTWDLVAPALAATRRVLAPDMRGYGGGARVGEAGYYYFPDYVFDVADLVDALVAGGRFHLVGHSMGGTVATLYAGTFPERVASLAILEGVGPPDNPPSVAPVRMRRWIEQVRKVREGGRAQPSLSPSEALDRLAANHPGVDRAILEGRVPHLASPAEGGRVTWAFDVLHRTVSPVGFSAAVYMEFAKLVTAPTLFVDGGPTGFHPPDEAERLACFAELERVVLDGAGHMMHWTRPDALAAALAALVERH
ncbi:MAG: alpha/beta hydrolase [Myxococcales bacterium]|nr:alpha/beta hydrolase [Myxococcales bacterium]